MHKIPRPRSSIHLSRSSPPPAQGKDGNHQRYGSRIVHIARCDRLHGWEQQHYADEEYPCARDGVDGFLPAAKSVRTRTKGKRARVDVAGQDDGCIGEV